LSGTTSSSLSVLGLEDDRVGVDGYDADGSAYIRRQVLASLLMGIRDITRKSGESEVWALGQDNGSFEAFQPLVRFLGLQFDKKSRLGLDICQSTFCRDFSTSELFLLISLL
jgi:hypothetical protein